ncbi:MAG TPA: M48 family metalloprotease, partial [Elusimicrobiota bacterium]|nr:M48 family metalloprotease [Elusimicrobiota bacterium]
MTRKILPLALLSGLAAAAGLLTARGGRSRESLLPALRAVQGEEKTLERLAGRALPVSVAEERRIGEAFDARVPRPADERSRAWEARLAELGGELSRSPSNRRLRRRYVFRVIAQDGSANAFTVAGGFVYVTAGLMRRVERDDDALRFVLGHEIGHSELGHCAD